jgi:putative endonuclease
VDDRIDRRALGERGEALARAYLEEAGLRVVTRNFRSRFGEIDLVMLDRDVLVYVEVRYRGGGSRLNALATVHAGKQRRLMRAAEYFILRRPQWRAATMRFDVVAIDGARDGAVSIEWLRDAFRP